MGGIIKIRLVNDLWWTEVSFDMVLEWNHFTVNNIDKKYCYVNVNGEEFEMLREDYNRLIDKKAFRLKFDIKKPKFF